MIEISVAGRADIGAVDRLLTRSYRRLLAADYPPSILVTALPRMSRAQPGLIASGSYYLARRDGILLGAGGWTRRAPTGAATRRGTAHVRHLAVDPDAVRQGVGRALIDVIVQQARGDGAVRLEALSTLTAVPFYAALGFEETGRDALDLGAGLRFELRRMVRPLSRG